MTLDKLQPGQSAKIVNLYGTGAIKRRLIDMGIIPGTEVTMKRTAPLGDPIEINIRGYELSLRKNEAKNIEITKF